MINGLFRYNSSKSNIIILYKYEATCFNYVIILRFDVRGSVHRSIIHTEIANKMQQCIKIYYSMFI